jgi:hypothetical protein
MADEAQPANRQSPASANPSPPAGEQPSPPADPSPPGIPGQSFGTSLQPALAAACDGRLFDISWFRTDWQRGGALTAYALWRGDDGTPRPAVVKVPVPPQERQWLLRLQDFENVVPRVYAHGETLGGYDMAWVVMERLPHGPLGHAWQGREFDLLVEAAGRFYAAATTCPVNQPPRDKDWAKVYDLARQNVRRHNLAHEQRWSKVLKKAHRKLHDWLKIWHDRPVDQWCHGDLHLANGMTRHPAPEGPAVLLDFALVHPGNWIEDAVYFEHLYWARPQRLGERRLCRQIAHERKKLGLTVEADWPRLASTRRALLAMSTPAVLQVDGDPHHVEAALHVLETEVGS